MTTTSHYRKIIAFATAGFIAAGTVSKTARPAPSFVGFGFDSVAHV